MNLRGKMVRVDIYKIGTSEILRTVIGKCKNIHTGQSIRDSSWIDLVDDRGNKIPTVKDVMCEYKVVVGEVK